LVLDILLHFKRHKTSILKTEVMFETD